MRGRLPFLKAVFASYGASWLLWNLFSYELTVELAGIQDKWQPFLTIVRVLFPFMYFGTPFLPDWLSIVAFLAFPAGFLVLARYLAEKWSLKLGAIAGAVWAAGAAIAAALSPHSEQANRLYHIARGEVGEALGSMLAIGVLELIMVAVVLNAVVYFGFALAGKFADRPRRTKPVATADSETATRLAPDGPAKDA